MGLGPLLSRGNRPVQGHQQQPRRSNGVLGTGGPCGGRFSRRAVSEGASGIRMDARTAQGHEMPALEPVPEWRERGDPESPLRLVGWVQPGSARRNPPAKKQEAVMSRVMPSQRNGDERFSGDV